MQIDCVDHYLKEWSVVTIERNKLFKKLGPHLENGKPEIIKSEKTMTALEEMVIKINDSP